MLTIPTSLDEAAEIDGASKWRIFLDVILPLSRPGIIALTIFTFVGNYQSFFWPLVMMRHAEKYTLPIGLLFFDSEVGQSTHLLMAAVTMSVLPMIILFVFLQKFLISGIQLGGGEGVAAGAGPRGMTNAECPIFKGWVGSAGLVRGDMSWLEK